MKIGLDYVGITTPFYCHDGKGNILMHKRTTECRDEHGRWDAGSGKLEFGLTLQENVLQEVFEEYGCKGVIERGLPPIDIFREHEGQKTHWLAIPFFVRVNPNEVINGEPHKIEEIKWFPINDLPEPLHTGFASGFNKYKKYFEEYFVKEN